MEIYDNRVAGTATIVLAGKFTIGTAAADVVGKVEELLARGTRKIVFDVSGVSNIDSTGIGYIIAAYGKIDAASAEMRIAGAAGAVLHTFQISQLDTIFEFRPSVEDALRD